MSVLGGNFGNNQIRVPPTIEITDNISVLIDNIYNCFNLNTSLITQDPNSLNSRWIQLLKERQSSVDYLNEMLQSSRYRLIMIKQIF